MDTVDNTRQCQASQDPGLSKNVVRPKKTRRDTTCFAPYCKSRYKHVSQGQKISLFATPRDPELFKKWERALHRADKELQPHSVVCERHFEDQFVERHYTHVIGEQVVRIPRAYPRLRSDAVPSILPGAPAYLSKTIPAKRQSKTSTGCRPVKYAKKESAPELRQISIESLANESSACCDPPVVTTQENIDVTACTLPNSSWTLHSKNDSRETAAFSVCSKDGHSITLVKVVLVQFCGSEILDSVCVQGTVGLNKTLHTLEEMSVLLTNVDKMVPFQGIKASGKLEDVLARTTANTKSHGS